MKNERSIGRLDNDGKRESKCRTGIINGSVTAKQNCETREFPLCGNQERIALASITNCKTFTSANITPAINLKSNGKTCSPYI